MNNKRIITTLMIINFIGMSSAYASPSMEDTIKWINTKSPLICKPMFVHKGPPKYRTSVKVKYHNKIHFKLDSPSIMRRERYRGDVTGKLGFGAARYEEIQSLDMSQISEFFVEKNEWGEAEDREKYDLDYKIDGLLCFSNSKDNLKRLTKALNHLMVLVKKSEPF